MESKCFNCGLYPEGVDVDVHGEFRNLFHSKYGTIHGLYVNELVRVVESVIKVHSKELEIVELVDCTTVSLLAHNRSPQDPHFFRKNAKTDLKRVSINRIPKNIYNKIMGFIESNYGTRYGSVSYLVNQAMELYIKMEKGYVKLFERFKSPKNSFIDDTQGQINLNTIQMLSDTVKTLNLKIDNLESVIDEKVKVTVQSTLNLVNKPVVRMSNSVKNTVKSFRREDKFEKSLKILENIMKYKEFNFTEKDYHKSLVKLTGQGDMRTVRSDLEMLELDNRVKKMRNNSNGTKTYQFTSNNQYHRYNTELAKERFLKGFKEAFQDINALTVYDLNGFIFKKYGLHDVQSQYKCLKWLLMEGCVERHEANPKLLLMK